MKPFLKDATWNNVSEVCCDVLSVVAHSSWARSQGADGCLQQCLRWILHPIIAQIACIQVHYCIHNRSISIYRHIDDELTSLKTARNTWILAALTQRWFYVVVRLSGFRKVLRKSLCISFYLYITLFCVRLAVFDSWFVPINYEQRQRRRSSARVHLCPWLFHVYLRWLLWCKWRLNLTVFGKQRFSSL